jgi:hypothetical protein
MGILDDAIREHLDLIRSRGATDSEVQRLEDEAFGPPTRPDEADFPESDEATAASANGVATEAPSEEHELEDPAVHEDATTLMPSAEADEEPAEAGEPGTGLEEPTGAHIAADPESEEMVVEHTEEPVAEVEYSEPEAEEHPIVEEQTAEEPQEEPSEEGAAPAEEGTALYDQSSDELDLQLDDEAAPAEAPSDEHPAVEPEGTTPLEPPIESLDTVEHTFHEEIIDTEEPHDEAAPSDEYAVEEPPAPEHEEEHAPEPSDEHAPEHDEEHAEGDEEEAGEDVLADTPEFLKDAPEDDELWFEQGEPKDFDF